MESKKYYHDFPAGGKSHGGSGQGTPQRLSSTALAGDKKPNGADRSPATPRFQVSGPDAPPSYTNAVFSIGNETDQSLGRRNSDISVISNSTSNADFMTPITVESAGSAVVDTVAVELPDDNRPLSVIEEIGQRMRSFRKRHHLTPAQREVVFAMNQFREKLKKATIDVYWLSDDGGERSSHRSIDLDTNSTPFQVSPF